MRWQTVRKGRFAAVVVAASAIAAGRTPGADIPPPVSPADGVGPARQTALTQPLSPADGVVQVRQPPVQPPPVQPPPVQPPPVQPPPVQPPSITDGAPDRQPGASAPPRPDAPAAAPAGAPNTSIPVSANQAAQVLNANDLGQFLNRSAGSTGVQSQQRNALVTDPRIRGLRSSQFGLYGDNGFFIPARLDLDTPVTRFDPLSVRDVVLVKGPYSVLYGPGLATLDVSTLDSPRSDHLEAHGRTSINYQTNGARWNGFQSAWASDYNWGARVSYNGMQGNDYRDGSGQLVPSSYQSHNVNWAVGFCPTEASRVEFKGLRAHQQNLEFPGLYFDTSRQDTEAYSLRYEFSDKGGPLDRVVLDTWYNTTVGAGDTSGGAKQAFVQKLLAVSFNPTFFPATPTAFSVANGLSPAGSIANASAAAVGGNPLNLFRDQSTSTFADSSLGYRLFADWGTKELGILTTGTDLRVVGQALQENIRLQQLSGRDLNTGALITPGTIPTFTQNQSIPPSNLVNPGLFAALEVPVTERWTVRSGGRADWVRTSTGNRQITGNFDLFGPAGGQNNFTTLDPIAYSSTGNPNTDRNFLLLAGYLQGEYKLAKGLTGVLSVGHSERAPSLTELYAAGPFVGVLQQGTSRLIGDPGLAPEKLTQLDIGLRADYDWFQAGVNGFYGWVNNYITYDQNKGGPGLTQVVYTNTDLATLAGAEMFTQIDLTTWLTGFGSLTYVQGVDQTHADNRRAANLASSRRNDPATGQYAAATEALPQIPPLETRVGFRVHQPAPERKWQVEFSARIVAGQNAVASSLGELPTPGFTTFTVRGYWQASDRLLLTAGVENLGDKMYREHLDPISGNIVGVNPLYRPGTNFYFGSQFTY